LSLDHAPRLVCREGNETSLTSELRARRLDAILIPGPPADSSGLKVTLLATSSVAVFATKTLTKQLKKRFPASLDGAPLLLPGSNSDARRLVEGWLTSRGLQPHIVGEFDDAGLREAFGAVGAGLIFAPELIGSTLKKMYGFERIGIIPDLAARYFLVAPDRRYQPRAQTAIENQAESPR
jgi:LysR family transcriptional activator of nhaA